MTITWCVNKVRPLSSYAFNCNLRHYTMEEDEEAARERFEARLKQLRCDYAEARFADACAQAERMKDAPKKVAALNAARVQHGALEATNAFLLEHHLDKTGWGGHPKDSLAGALAARLAGAVGQGRHWEARK